MAPARIIDEAVAGPDALDFSDTWRRTRETRGAASIAAVMPDDAAGVVIALRGGGLSGNADEVAGYLDAIRRGENEDVYGSSYAPEFP